VRRHLNAVGRAVSPPWAAGPECPGRPPSLLSDHQQPIHRPTATHGHSPAKCLPLSLFTLRGVGCCSPEGNPAHPHPSNAQCGPSTLHFSGSPNAQCGPSTLQTNPAKHLSLSRPTTAEQQTTTQTEPSNAFLWGDRWRRFPSFGLVFLPRATLTIRLSTPPATGRCCVTAGEGGNGWTGRQGCASTGLPSLSSR